jgi:nucleotide-binding universal stress UspA family protein
MFKKILVPLDGSPTAEAVLPLVIHIAKLAKAEVELITVLTPVAIWDAAATMIRWDAEEEAAKAYISSKAKEVSEAGITAHSMVAFGPAAYAIFDAAKDTKADFIAMTTHGRSGVSRFVLGSVADKLLHTAAPLLVVRPSNDEKAQTLSPSDIRKVFVPLDGSELSLAAIPSAEEIARMFNSDLVFCNVVSTDWIAYSGMETPVLYQDVLEEGKARARTNLETIASQSRERGFAAHGVVGLGGPADEIERLAREQDANLIVMSTHGRSGPSRWFMGSVADAVVRRTHLPCLLVRPNQVKEQEDGQKEVGKEAPAGQKEEVAE